jgi:hypothetical protein
MYTVDITSVFKLALCWSQRKMLCTILFDLAPPKNTRIVPHGLPQDNSLLQSSICLYPSAQWYCFVLGITREMRKGPCFYMGSKCKPKTIPFPPPRIMYHSSDSFFSLGMWCVQSKLFHQAIHVRATYLAFSQTHCYPQHSGLCFWSVLSIA